MVSTEGNEDCAAVIRAEYGIARAGIAVLFARWLQTDSNCSRYSRFPSTVPEKRLEYIPANGVLRRTGTFSKEEPRAASHSYVASVCLVSSVKHTYT